MFKLYMAQTIFLYKKKVIKSGDQYFFSIPKRYIDDKVILLDTEYRIVLEEAEK